MQRAREMQAELEQAHRLRAASVTAATAADIRAKAAEIDAAAAERKASEAVATAESAAAAEAAAAVAPGVESEAVAAAEGPAAGARPRKLHARRGGRTGSNDSAGHAAAEKAAASSRVVVDARDYQVPTASQRAPGIEVNSVFVSKVRRSCLPPPTLPCSPCDASLPRPPHPAPHPDALRPCTQVERFQGPNSIYANARSSSPVVVRNKRALNDLDANGAHPDDTPRKRATRVSRRQADAAV